MMRCTGIARVHGWLKCCPRPQRPLPVRVNGAKNIYTLHTSCPCTCHTRERVQPVNRFRNSSCARAILACLLSKTATSASTACASSARAPLRKTSLNGSEKVPGWQSQKH
jgi:hypothetical protein